MACVLCMAAFEICNPVTNLVLVKANDLAIHTNPILQERTFLHEEHDRWLSADNRAYELW